MGVDMGQIMTVDMIRIEFSLKITQYSTKYNKK
jgi:hypothetical protein